MLAAFNVTALADFGYPETTHFIDPMEQRYRASDFSESDFQSRSGVFSEQSIKDKLNFFIGLEAYSKVDEVESALADYWSTHTSGSVATSTSKGVVGSGTTSAPTTLKTSTTKSSSSATPTKTA